MDLRTPEADALAHDWIGWFLARGREDAGAFVPAIRHVIDWEQVAIDGLTQAIAGFDPAEPGRTFSAAFALQSYRNAKADAVKASQRDKRRGAVPLGEQDWGTPRGSHCDTPDWPAELADSARVTLGRVADSWARLYLVAGAYDGMTPAAIGRANGCHGSAIRVRIARAIG